MIHLSLAIRNLWKSNRFSVIFSKTGKTPFRHKFWEIQFNRDSCLATVCMSIDHRCDHAGVLFEVGAFGYSMSFNFYDNRHWDYVNGTWQNIGDSDGT